MHITKRTTLMMFSLVLGMLLFVAACGNNGSSTGSGNTSSATPVATSGTSSTSNSNTPDTSGYGGGKYGGGQTTPTASSAKGDIKMATVTVSGKSETVLTNAQGMTLYYRTSDTPPTSVCSGGCADAWPPLVVTGSSAPASSTALAGKLSVQMTANGQQVEYNGHPLYTFSGDTASGQANGEGIGSVWYVVTPDLH